MKEQDSGEFTRRQFLKRAAVVAAALPILPLGFAALNSSGTSGRALAQDWAGAADSPGSLFWKTRITEAAEPGEPLLITGTIFRPDGVTPAEGITLYVYHTDARGYYSNEKGDVGPPKPRLRGWMKTGADGRYEFRTIRPGGYPGRIDPEHIHATLSGPGYTEYWIDSFWFENDPRVTPEQRAKLSGRGGFQPVIALQRDGQGVLRGTRNIKLQQV
ncbi:MAG TPA: twin-arginine translocation signal domain-containing protein [Pyrinomonadaceae bacterium]|nr:twin-arginine translocation signal domain-containing protein [Pyrinomonadaceae bacterium]